MQDSVPNAGRALETFEIAEDCQSEVVVNWCIARIGYAFGAGATAIGVLMDQCAVAVWRDIILVTIW